LPAGSTGKADRKGVVALTAQSRGAA
jgi:hypothetical protein